MLLRTRNVKEESSAESQNTHFLFNIFFLYRLWYDVEKDGTAGQATNDITRLMYNACCVTKDTETQSDYMIIMAFWLHQWLCKRASVLRSTYIAYPFPLKYVWLQNLSYQLKVALL